MIKSRRISVLSKQHCQGGGPVGAGGWGCKLAGGPVGAGGCGIAEARSLQAACETPEARSLQAAGETPDARSQVLNQWLREIRLT